MHEPSIGQWADYYARQGWKLFPVHGASLEGGCTCGDENCLNPGKHPANKNGFKGASDQEFVVDGWFAKGDRNIGLATGAASGVFVLDVDGPEGERSLRALQEEHGRLPATKVSTTGRGSHYFFRMPDGRVPNSTSKVGPKLDIRGDGGYVILPPSHHASGAVYRWQAGPDPIAVAPQWLVDTVVAKEEPEVEVERLAAGPADEATEAKIRDALAHLDPDCSYDDWLAIGMAIHAMGGDFDLWDSWSANGAKYNGKEMATKWRSFTGSGVAEGTLWRLAEAAGWSHEPAVEVNIDPTPTPKISAPVQQEEEDRDHPLIPTHEPKLGFTPSSLPGLIGETVNWILSGAIKPQPELSLLAVLGGVAAVAGRKYESEVYRTKPNLYLCSIAPSGSGKDHPRQCMMKLFADAGLSDRHMGDQEFISATGLLNSLSQKPSQIMLIDEIGAVMSNISRGNAASYEVKLRTLLLKLFSSSGGRIDSGTYADKKRNPIVIDEPALSIYGSTTPKTYTKGLSIDMVESGEINRWVALSSSVGLPKTNFEAYPSDPPESLRSAWMRIGDASAPAANEGDVTGYDEATGPFRPRIVVAWSDAAKATLRGMQKDLDDKQQDLLEMGYYQLWGRAVEQTMKISMLFAICRDPVKPEVNIDDWAHAHEIVCTSVDYLVWTIHHRVNESGFSYAELEARIEEALRNAGKKGLSKTQISRACKGVPARQYNEALTTMEEQGRLRREIKETKGRSREVFFAKGFGSLQALTGG